MSVTCSTCGQPVQGGECPYCRAATAIAAPAHAAQVKVKPPPANDGAFSAGPPPARVPLAPPKDQATAAGCFLTLICTAVIFGTVVPIVTWRDRESGLALPTWSAIAAPLFLGGLCYALGVAILKYLGIATIHKPTEPPDADNE